MALNKSEVFWGATIRLPDPFVAAKITEEGGGMARVETAAGGWSCPAEYLLRHLQELRGDWPFGLDAPAELLPPPEYPYLKFEGHSRPRWGEFIGRGHDGSVFHLGNGYVVKVAGITHYQPGNGMRSPDEALLAGRAAARYHKLLSPFVPAIPQITSGEHAGLHYMIKPLLKVGNPPPAVALDMLHDMHAAGYAVGDLIQMGSQDGAWYLLDLGGVRKLTATGRQDDLDAYRSVYYATHGVSEYKREGDSKPVGPRLRNPESHADRKQLSLWLVNARKQAGDLFLADEWDTNGYYAARNEVDAGAKDLLDLWRPESDL